MNTISYSAQYIDCNTLLFNRKSKCHFLRKMNDDIKKRGCIEVDDVSVHKSSVKCML